MFRASLRPTFLLLIALFAAAPAAEAAVDVTAVTLTVTLAHSSVDTDSFAVALRVTGTNLNNGTITPPLVAVPSLPISLKKDGSGSDPDLVFDKTYSSEATLRAAWPDGSYALRINNSTLQSTLVYTRPLVPDPAISEPNAGGVIPPGTVELMFMACAVCNQIGDSVVAVLEDATTMAVLDQETLTSTSDSWIPQGAMGDLVLPELSSFLASVTDTALRQANTLATGDDDNILLFSNKFVQSDEIDFTTGFHTPTGHICLSANHPAPPAGCNLLSDTLLQVLNTSGVYNTTVNGHAVTYDLRVASNGSLSGSAAADLDDNGSQETGPAPIKGKLKGKDGESSEKPSFTLDNPSIPAKLKIKISELFSISGNTQSSTQKNSGTDGTTKVNEEFSSSGPLTQTPLGWVLEFDIDDTDAVSNASLALEGGQSFPLTGSNKFKFKTGESTLKLQSSDKGIRIDLKNVTFDDTTPAMTTVSGGSVSQKILGQSGKSDLPILP